MKRSLLFITTLFFLLGSLSFSPRLFSEEESLIVVGHPTLAVDQINKRDLASYFLKTKRFWSDGTPIRPIDWMEGQPTRTSFLSKILNKTENELIEFWISQKLTTGNRPPITLEGGSDICQMVLNTPGSISYFLSSSPELKSCLKIKIIGSFH